MIDQELYRIKPLVWEKYSTLRPIDRWEAKVPFTRTHYYDVRKTGTGLYIWYAPEGAVPPIEERTHEAFEEAREAAESHYISRLKEALEPVDQFEAEMNKPLDVIEQLIASLVDVEMDVREGMTKPQIQRRLHNLIEQAQGIQDD